jgi:hypothetical protein
MHSSVSNATAQGTAMNESSSTARKERDFHWAWYLVPIGTISVVLLSVIVLRAILPGDGLTPTLAKNVMPIAIETTVVVPALPAKPVEGRPAP